jgi:hypothetical protein
MDTFRLRLLKCVKTRLTNHCESLVNNSCYYSTATRLITTEAAAKVLVSIVVVVVVVVVMAVRDKVASMTGNGTLIHHRLFFQ